MEVLFVTPDYYAEVPKACMDGWGRRFIVISPDGLALPCHAAHTLPGLRFDSVRDRALGEIWRDSAGFTAFRGEAWMPEPCRSCDRRGTDFGGCRCQSFHLTGDATATDPVCRLSPDHGIVLDARRRERSLDPHRELVETEPPEQTVTGIEEREPYDSAGLEDVEVVAAEDALGDLQLVVGAVAEGDALLGRVEERLRGDRRAAEGPDRRARSPGAGYVQSFPQWASTLLA